MKELSLLEMVSLVIGFIILVLIFLRIYLDYRKKISYNSDIRLIKTIAILCATKVLMFIVMFNVFGIFCWLLTMLIWLMIGTLEKNEFDNRERIRRGEETVYLKPSDVFLSVGKFLKNK